LTQGANIDAKDVHDLTALHHAALQGDLEIVRFLLNRGSNVNEYHYYLGTPIFVAALRRHKDVVEALLKHRASLSVPYGDLATALHCACFGGDVAIFELMLAHGQHGDLTRVQGVQLEVLASIADTSLASYLAIARRIRRRTSSSKIRCSPILLAAERCHFDLLRLCRSKLHNAYRSAGAWEVIDMSTVQKDASQDSTWSFFGFSLPIHTVAPLTSTLLMWGAASLNLPLIEHLLEAGEQTDTRDRLGLTALHYAALPLEHATFEDVGKCFARLLQGSTISLQTAEILLRMMFSIKNMALDPRTSYKWGLGIHSRCVASILDYMASAHERQTASSMALIEVVSYDICPAESIELLCKNATILDADASQLARARKCFTAALHRAVNGFASNAIILTLLYHGADPNDCSDSRRLPLTSAVLGLVNREIVPVLLDHGADPYTIEQKEPWMGETPYSIATKRKEQDLIELFTRASSEQAQTIRKVNESTDSGASQSTVARADVPSVLRGREDHKPLAKAALKTTRRSWFAGISAFPLPRFRKDGGSK
jgi:ankyrin repeat protein